MSFAFFAKPGIHPPLAGEFMRTSTGGIPQGFIWRKLHSLAGFGLVIYLFFHLFTNSQAALYIGDDGKGFIHAVNAIHDIPYLQVVEILIVALPILIHMAWGIQRLRAAQPNSSPSDGSKPSLPEYPRNRAYTWQRITSWLLIVGIIAHVVHMRFIESPLTATVGTHDSYVVRVTQDPGLPLLADRLGVTLYHAADLKNLKESSAYLNDVHQFPEEIRKQREKELHAWMKTVEKRPLQKDEVIAVADNFGTAELLVVRDTFKIPMMMVLYTILVLVSSFHAFNGLWTWMISWGVTLSQRAQRLMRYVCNSLMFLVSGFGLAAIWLTYWINLKT